MAVSYGFYSALYSDEGYDRFYHSWQMSKIFDGLILDGVYLSAKEGDPINKQFMVTADTEDMNVTVASGRAWFLGTFTVSDSDLVLTVGTANSTYGRIDAVVIEVNTKMTQYDDPENPTERFNSIKIVEGTPSANPEKPTMVHENGIDQFPIAYITVDKGATMIKPFDIDYVVGIETPYFAWLCEGLTISEIYSKWKSILGNLTLPFVSWFNSMKRMLGNGEQDYPNILNELDTIADIDYVKGICPRVDEELQKFDGDGSTVDFTLDIDEGTIVKGIADIYVDGKIAYDFIYDPETYTITLATAPSAGTDNVEIYYVADALAYTLYFEEV